jgi:hypothetical protein
VEHRHSRLFVGIESDERLVQGPCRVRIHRIAQFPPVQRHQSDRPELFDMD